jgi:Protein of unknown function (DUF1616)
MRGHRDLRAVAGLALVCAIVAPLVPLDWLALAFAAPFALLLPGYAITAATFARRRLEWPQLLLLSLALSLATLALGGLVLNYVPGGIRPLSWAALLVVVVLNGCRTAALRREAPVRRRRPRPQLRVWEAGLVLGGLAAAIAAIVLASTTVPAKNVVGYSQLWILPKAGSGESEALIGVRSEEQNRVDFDLRIRIGQAGGAANGVQEAGQATALSPEVVRRSFTLKPGEAHTVTVGPPAAPPGAAVPVVATLLRHNRPQSVYRRVKGRLVAPESRQ